MYYRLISEDTKCRKELLSIRDFIEKNNKVYPKWVDINKIKERVEKFKNLTDEKIFDNYIEIETRIFDLYQDSYDAMCYLDGYIQYLVDQYRGK